MDALLLTLGAAAVFLVAYFTYGRWLARRVFRLDPNATTPANELCDDRDYCPTRRSVVFGHHFTSIAGTGPIVGPAIAVMWGWLPAVLWVVVGAVFMGAVHDLGSLVVSMRNKGRSVGDIAGDLLGPRVRLIFLVILVVALWIVLAIFGLVIAAVLRQYPGAIFPVLVQIPLAVLIGMTVHRKGGSIFLPSAIALLVMYLSVIYGDWGPLHAFNAFLAAQPTILWVAGLLIYAYVASVLPVWTLLQPRDYINALQLVTALGLLVLGLIVAATIGGAPDEFAGATDAARPELRLVAPVYNPAPEGAPPMIPILFITIACGAISGFHCLVSSGTTSKQLQSETDAQAVGYGSMLTEGFLATLVIVSCAAGLGLATIDDHVDTSTRFDTSKGKDAHSSYEAMDIFDIKTPTGLYQISVEDDSRRRQDPEQFSEHDQWPRIEIARGQFGQRLDDVQNQVLDSSWVEFGNSRIWVNPDFGGEFRVSGAAVFSDRYSSWTAAGSLGAKVAAFVDGAANLIKSIGIPASAAVALMGVLVASFAGTTMDTACRLQRYVIQELARTFLPRPNPLACTKCGYNLRGLPPTEICPECAHPNEWRLDFGGHPEEGDAPHLEGDLIERHASRMNPFRWLATTHGATLFAVITALALAAIPAPGQAWTLTSAGMGGLLLWPLFGATNQLLAGLAFCVIGAWLIATKRPWWFIALPTALMLVLPAWAMSWQAFVGDDSTPSWIDSGDWLLVGVAIVILALEAWLVAETLLRIRSAGARDRQPSATDNDPTGSPLT